MKRGTALGLLGSTTLGSLLPHAATAETVTLHMATLNVDAGAEPYYAQEAGFFAADGLHADFLTFDNGSAIAAAIAGGALDIATSNAVALAQAHARGIPLVVLSPGALYESKEPSSLLMVPTSSALRRAADFTGKTIAVNGLNGLPEYCTRAYLDAAGVQSANVKFLEMSYPQMVDALAAARVDGAVVSEPFVTPGERVARVIGAPFDACALRFVTSLYISTRTWADAHRDEVGRFQDAMFKTARWANRNQSKTASILMDYTKLPAETIKTMRRVRFAESWDDANAQPLIDLAAKYGNVPRFSINDIIYRV
jgi:NitT/TauT family transport system substrate-binding protein